MFASTTGKSLLVFGDTPEVAIGSFMMKSSNDAGRGKVARSASSFRATAARVCSQKLAGKIYSVLIVFCRLLDYLLPSITFWGSGLLALP